MSVENVLSLIQENEVKFVDLRFTDTKVKSNTSLSLLTKSTQTSSKKVKCSMVHQLLAGKALTNQTWL